MTKSNGSIRRGLTVAGIAILISLIQSVSHASLGEWLSVGNAKAAGLGNAVTADPPGIDSIIYNPAGLSRLPVGKSYNLHAIIPDMKMEADIYHPDNSLILEVSPGNAPGLFSFMCDQGFIDPEFWGRGPQAEADFYAACDETFKNQPVVTDTNGKRIYAAQRSNGGPNKVIHSESNGVGVMAPGMKLQNLEGFMIGPGLSLGYRPEGSPFAFATGAYADMGGVGRPEDDPARFEGQIVAQVRFSYFTPSFSYSFNDRLHVGMSMAMAYQAMGMKMPLRLPNIGIGFIQSIQDQTCEFDESGIHGTPTENTAAQILWESISLCGGLYGAYSEIGEFKVEADKNFSLQFTFGVLWEPTDWLTIGASYRPEVKDTLKGDFRIDYTNGWVELFGRMRENPENLSGNPQDIGNTIFNILDLDFLCGNCMPYGSFDPGPGHGYHVQGELGSYYEESGLEMDVYQPAILSMGVSTRIVPRLKVNFDVRWVDYSSMDVVLIKFDKTLDFLRIMQLLADAQFGAGQTFNTHSQMGMPMGMNAAWHWAIGTEFQYNDRLAFRAGWEPRKTAIPDDKLGLFAPFGDTDIYGLGFSYRMAKGSTLDFSLMYLITEEVIKPNQSTMVNSVEWNHFAQNPYPGSRIVTKISGLFAELNYITRF